MIRVNTAIAVVLMGAASCATRPSPDLAEPSNARVVENRVGPDAIRPFHFTASAEASAIFAGASPRRGGRRRRRWPITRKACNWRRCRSSPTTGRPTTTGARCEAKLNALPQFVTKIDGLDIHFIHVRSKHPNALPIIITHGWPGSIIEQMKIIGPLTDPTAYGGTAEDAFDVVIPSLPGYGFSGKPTAPGWNPATHRHAHGRR